MNEPKKKRGLAEDVKMEMTYIMDLLRNEAHYQDMAKRRGLYLRISVLWIGNSGRFTLKWRIDSTKTGRQVMDYWPSTGKWKSASKMGVELNVEKAFKVALGIVNRTTQN